LVTVAKVKIPVICFQTTITVNNAFGKPFDKQLSFFLFNTDTNRHDQQARLSKYIGMYRCTNPGVQQAAVSHGHRREINTAIETDDSYSIFTE